MRVADGVVRRPIVRELDRLLDRDLPVLNANELVARDTGEGKLRDVANGTHVRRGLKVPVNDHAAIDGEARRSEPIGLDRRPDGREHQARFNRLAVLEQDRRPAL